MDVGLNWNISDRARTYAKIDNVTNAMPPDTGSLSAANSIYDVVWRMFRIGVCFNN